MGDRLGARDHVSLMHLSGFDCEVALSRSEASQRHLIIPLDRCAVAVGWASAGTGGIGAGVRGQASCGVCAVGLTPTGVFSAPLCHQLC